MPRGLAFSSFLIAFLFSSLALAQDIIGPVTTIRLSRPTILDIDRDTISWSSVQHAETYRIRWRPSSGGRWKPQSVSASTTSYRITGLSRGIEYKVQVQARSSNSRHLYSYYSQAENILIPKPKALDKPSLRHVSGTTVAWNKVEGAVAYVLHINDLGRISRRRLPASSDKYTFLNFRPGPHYEIRLSARGDGLTYKRSGPLSNIVKITIPFPPTETPVPPTDTPPPTPTKTPIPTVSCSRKAGTSTWRVTEDRNEPNYNNGCLYTVTYERILERIACTDDREYNRVVRDWVKIHSSGPHSCFLSNKTENVSAMSIAVAGPYIAPCRSSGWVSYTVIEQLPVGYCPGFGLPCECTRTCQKQCCSGNRNRCWNEGANCSGCTYQQRSEE